MSSLENIKTLRELTGAGLKDCKTALAENNDDMDAAVDWLRKKGIVTAAKKSSRAASEGMVAAGISANMQKGVLLEVNCETDFVARTDGFKGFVSELSGHILANNPADIEELKTQSWTHDVSTSVDNVLSSMVHKTGENVQLRRFVTLQGGYVSQYIHAGSRLGVLLAVDCDASQNGNADFQSFIEDICMHIAANRPQFVSDAEIPEEVVQKEMEIQVSRSMEDDKFKGKPKDIVEKAVSGRIAKWKKEISLLNQLFDEETKATVEKCVADKSKEFGFGFSLKSFVVFELGEGLEKRKDNFAEEVAAMTQQ